MNEITDLHFSERALMELWNDFLLQIRITHFGRNMLYKASVIFLLFLKIFDFLEGIY